MVSRFLLVVFAVLAWNAADAQTPADTLQTGVHADPRLRMLVFKHNDVQKRGQANGYRVQIYFGTDKAKARDVKSRFLAAHASEAKAYEVYDQPNFKVRVGDFRTQLEAYRFLKKIRGEYPASFIVTSRIELPPVK